MLNYSGLPLWITISTTFGAIGNNNYIHVKKHVKKYVALRINSAELHCFILNHILFLFSVSAVVVFCCFSSEATKYK